LPSVAVVRIMLDRKGGRMAWARYCRAGLTFVGFCGGCFVVCWLLRLVRYYEYWPLSAALVLLGAVLCVAVAAVVCRIGEKWRSRSAEEESEGPDEPSQ